MAELLNCADALGRVLTNVASTNLTNNFVYSSSGLARVIDGDLAGLIERQLATEMAKQLRCAMGL